MHDLTRNPLFSGLDPQSCNHVLATAREVRVARARYLFHEHEQARTLYLLLSGWVRLFKLSGDGRQSVIRLVGPTEIAGISALIDQGVYHLTAQTISPCHLLAWDHHDLVHLMEHDQHIRENALQLLSSYLNDLQQQYLELATERVEQRIAHALVRMAVRHEHLDETSTAVVVPISQRDLADLVGVTHYTVSRVLGEWREQRLVVTGRAVIQILDLQALLQRSEQP